MVFQIFQKNREKRKKAEILTRHILLWRHTKPIGDKSATRRSRLTIWCKNTYNSTIYYHRISKKSKLLIFREVHIMTSRWRHTTKSSSKIYSIIIFAFMQCWIYALIQQLSLLNNFEVWLIFPKIRVFTAVFTWHDVIMTS